MRSLALILAVAGISLLCACDYPGATRQVYLANEAKYVDSRCAGESMVGSKEGLKAAIEVKYDELKSASGSISAEKYSALSQELKSYTASAQILHQEQYQRCKVYYQCVYRTTLKSESLDLCAADDASVKETADRIRAALLKIQTVEVK